MTLISFASDIVFIIIIVIIIKMYTSIYVKIIGIPNHYHEHQK